MKVMATSTVLRVKRRLEESPQDALVLMCKRIKTDSEEISPSLFVFRATVDNQETTFVKKLLPKETTKLKNVNNVEDIINKMRKEKQEVASKNRYEIVKCSRGIKDTNSKENDEVLNLIDMVKRHDKDEDIQYTYDLYTSWKHEFDISMIDNFVGVETDLVFDTYCSTNQDNSDNGADDDDDDSNDENNWRNNYPDSEPSTIDEEDIVRAMERVDLDDLSSDTGEDKIYDDPTDLFSDDVERYGEAYAKYKARVISQNPELNNSNSLIQCSRIQDDGYKDDSDDGFYYGEEEDSEQFKEQYRDNSSSDGYSPD